MGCYTIPCNRVNISQKHVEQKRSDIEDQGLFAIIYVKLKKQVKLPMGSDFRIVITLGKRDH